MGRSPRALRAHEADDLEQANEALARFADLYDTGQIPEIHDVVDKIITWGEEILAYHPGRRATNGPLEGINNLLQVLRRVAHGFTNYQKLRRPRTPRNMTPDTGTRTPKPMKPRSLEKHGHSKLAPACCPTALVCSPHRPGRPQRRDRPLPTAANSQLTGEIGQ